MAQVTIEARSAACAEGVCDLFLFPALDPPGPEGYEVSAAVFAMKPRSRGTVRLTSPDPRAPLAIDHGFLTDERDVAVLVEGVEALRRMAASEEVSAYAAREVRPGAEVDARAPRARGRARLLPSGRHVRDRRGGRRRRPGARAARACRSPTPRSCRRSRARTRTCARSRWPSGSPSGSQRGRRPRTSRSTAASTTRRAVVRLEHLVVGQRREALERRRRRRCRRARGRRPTTSPARLALGDQGERRLEGAVGGLAQAVGRRRGGACRRTSARAARRARWRSGRRRGRRRAGGRRSSGPRRRARRAGRRRGARSRPPRARRAAPACRRSGGAARRG